MEKNNPLLTNMKNKVESLQRAINMLLNMCNGGTVELNFPCHQEFTIKEENREKSLNETLPKLMKEQENLISRIRRQEPDYYF